MTDIAIRVDNLSRKRISNLQFRNPKFYSDWR